MSADLGVVVIGRNEGERLVRCLESVAAMRLPGRTVEVVYVDSASTDGSPERARAAGARVVALGEGPPSAARGRNAGWQETMAPVVLFLDGDTVLDPDFVARALPDLEAGRTAVVWGHRRELRPWDSVYNRVLDLDWLYAPGETDFCGGDALVRRQALEETGGFDASLIAGEEPELCRRLRARGWTIRHVDLPMTGHDLAIRRFSQYWRRSFRAGRAYAEVAARFRGTSDPLWEGVVRWNRRSAVVLLGALPAGGAAALLLRTPWPLAAAALGLAFLCARSAWRMRWKTRDRWTLALYGVHSHFAQVPIFLGQLAYARDRRLGRARGLIEYKETAR